MELYVIIVCKTVLLQDICPVLKVMYFKVINDSIAFLQVHGMCALTFGSCLFFNKRNNRYL